MALSMSQALCEAMVGDLKAYRSGARLSLVDGGAGHDQIVDGAGLLVASGFAVGDLVQIIGATSASNISAWPVISAATGALDLPTGSLVAGETSGNAALKIQSFKRGSLQELFYMSQLDIYTGSKPSSADAAEIGTLLASFTNICLGEAGWDAVNKKAYFDLTGGTPITAVAAASGTAGYFRLRGGRVFTTGASTTMIRIDGTVGVGTGDCQLYGTNFTAGAAETITSVKLFARQA